MKLQFIVTAGPTREYLDPVRFLSNPSTGRMGFAVAERAAKAEHEVILIAGPVNLKTPPGVRRVDVVSARDMLKAVQDALASCTLANTVLVMTAAVADWRPKSCASKKLKKAAMQNILHLTRNPDILKTVSRRFAAGKKNRPVLIGFAAETGSPTAEAARKCREKGLDLVVANDVTAAGAGFGTSTNAVTFVYPTGATTTFPLMTKLHVAKEIVSFAARAQKRLVLASGSPRRAKILDEMGVPYTLLKTDAPEVAYPHDPERTVRENAELKAAAARAKLGKDAFILAADTIVWFNNRIYGKPRDLNEARAMLRELSGQMHVVYTGVSLGGVTSIHKSHVYFKKLSEKTIAQYVTRIKPLDRAGAYDIDESGDLLIRRHTGSYENIMGLPCEPIRKCFY